MTTIEIFSAVKNVFRLIGCPHRITQDNGTQFEIWLSQGSHSQFLCHMSLDESSVSIKLSKPIAKFASKGTTKGITKPNYTLTPESDVDSFIEELLRHIIIQTKSLS